MEDFNALAAALGAGIADLRGCLILSRDGLVLGEHPHTAEQELKAAWLRFAALGEPERGFVQFGNETWSLARRGSYGSFAVTGIGVRPGVVIDHMEQLLLAAEEARSKDEGSKVAAPVPVQPSQASRASAKRKKRRSLRGDPGPIEEAVAINAEGLVGLAASAARHPASEAVSEEERGPEPVADPSSGEHGEPTDTAPSVGPETFNDEDEIDRYSLAAEFSRLLQDKREGADG